MYKRITIVSLAICLVAVFSVSTVYINKTNLTSNALMANSMPVSVEAL